MSADNRLIDTNVMVYAYDVSEKAKRHAARALLLAIVTENERDFKKIPGLTVINPFKVQLKHD